MFLSPDISMSLQQVSVPQPPDRIELGMGEEGEGFLLIANSHCHGWLVHIGGKWPYLAYMFVNSILLSLSLLF